ncbi:hypothetical protein K3725_00485 [Leisingera sp. S132]|uniref:hypothetical protein n=1 Tax=Leisingera sp. S132 TaxID=2867016 RepID=UPI0021A3DEA2|nr:hypothetical protein [Leisingera sp. S132]UWQ79520.1 hypothetical protein K3725_00485 [Leisingera sp. S132]
MAKLPGSTKLKRSTRLFPLQKCAIFLGFFPARPAAAETWVLRGLAQGCLAGQSCPRTAPECGR